MTKRFQHIFFIRIYFETYYDTYTACEKSKINLQNSTWHITRKLFMAETLSM